MLLPLTGQINTRDLIGKVAFVYGVHFGTLTLKKSHGISAAMVTRHVKPFNCLDLELRSSFSDSIERVKVSAVGLRLLNPDDRVVRPWWSETARRHAAERRWRQ